MPSRPADPRLRAHLPTDPNDDPERSPPSPPPRPDDEPPPLPEGDPPPDAPPERLAAQ